MPELTISEAARQVGLKASAIRYYERIGLLPRAPRMSGQRRYDTTALYRLAIIQRARQLGFTLSEIRHICSLVSETSLALRNAGERFPSKSLRSWII
jgi:MerR family redox-sensitive transcriptional activator SoxR